jgi:hypothetical protein
MPCRVSKYEEPLFRGFLWGWLKKQGWIAWRARDIAPAMIAHGMIDGVAQIVGGTW